MLLTNRGPEKTCILEIKRNILKMFRSVTCVITDQFWNFHEHPFIHCFHDVANSHDAAPSIGTVEQSGQAWNI